MEYATSSFSENLRRYAPELLPGSDFGNATARGQDIAPHGTTIVAVAYRGGVLLAGDRRGTMGNLLASRDMDRCSSPIPIRLRASRAPSAWPSR